MYIGKLALETLLNDESNFIDWFLVESINDNKSEIELSYGNRFTINASMQSLYDMIDESTKYTLPPINEIGYKFFAINPSNIDSVTDLHIRFKDNSECENLYENSNILIEMYQLSFDIEHHNHELFKDDIDDDFYNDII